MPTLAAPLDCAKLEIRQQQIHQLIGAPTSPVKGQMYYNTSDNTFYWWDNAGWVSARGGASATPPATTSALGTVQLAGDLGGTSTSATAPIISDNAITTSKVATANKDGSAAVPCMRSLGPTAGFAMAGNLPLDQHPIPTADLNFNSKKVTNLATPISGTDAANKAYVDAAAQNLDVKASCRVASVLATNINLASAPTTIDGVTMVTGDRVLVSQQSTNTQNGIYVWNGAAAAMTRSLDADTGGVGGDITSGMFTFVEEGGTNADSGWVMTTDGVISIGTSPIVFTQFSGAGQINAGNGLTKTGNTIDVVGTSQRITVLADSIDIASTYVGQGSIRTLGKSAAAGGTGAVNDGEWQAHIIDIPYGGHNGSSATQARANLGVPTWYTALWVAGGTTWTILQSAHLMVASAAIVVQVQLQSTGAIILPDVTVNPSSGDVAIAFSASQGANTIRATLIGLQAAGGGTQPV
jgi:hypothetical protein